MAIMAMMAIKYGNNSNNGNKIKIAIFAIK
jgi:hypothetical protein